MRTLSLLTVAIEAEALRLRRELAAFARSAAWGLAGAGFAAAGIVMLHIAAWYWLLPHLGLPVSATAIALFDLCVAGILLLISRPSRDPVAEEAARLRAISLQATRNSSGLVAGLLDGRGQGSAAGAVAGMVADAAIAWWRRR